MPEEVCLNYVQRLGKTFENSGSQVSINISFQMFLIDYIIINNIIIFFHPTWYVILNLENNPVILGSGPKQHP